jgi:hypothetical protein
VSYTIAWVVAIGAGAVGWVGLFFLTRSVRPDLLRWLLRVLPPLLLLVPAPVPGYAGYIAPAFVVFVFETVFQAHGRPAAAILILVVTGAVGALVTLLLTRARRPKKTPESAAN